MTNEQLVSKTTVSSIDIREVFELEDVFFSSGLLSQKLFTWFHGFSSAGLCPQHAVCVPSFGLYSACLSCWFSPLSSIEFSPFFGNCRIFGKDQFSLISNFVLLRSACLLLGSCLFHSRAVDVCSKHWNSVS